MQKHYRWVAMAVGRRTCRDCSVLDEKESDAALKMLGESFSVEDTSRATRL